jgi:hypothetical protein
MGIRSLRSALGVPALSLVVLLLAACEGPVAVQPESEPLLRKSGSPDASQEELLKAVRQATARFNSTTQAEKAGYLVDTHCVAVPGLGGMGYHWVNPDFVDAVFDPLQPEVVLYATGPGGNLRLVAVEYIVLDEGQDHPSFGGRDFDVGGTPVPVPHWSLHVWLYENNPNGLFTPFNPSVTCP